MKFTHIDSFGKCLHNTAMLQSRKDTVEDNHYDVKVNLLIKIWHGYLSQTIPIYYGAPDVYEQVPEITLLLMPQSLKDRKSWQSILRWSMKTINFIKNTSILTFVVWKCFKASTAILRKNQ